jgi:Fur family ferric uptake transcriptional regulator
MGDSTGSPCLRTQAEGVSFPNPIPMASPRSRKATPSDDDLAEQLRAAGLRRTQPRIAVLRHMLKVGQPVAHAEVAEALAKLKLDRVSVYRVLVDLARVKILTRTDMGDHVWRFDLSRGDRSHGREHPHFVCVGCGTVECLPEKAVQLFPQRKGPRALRKGDVEVQLRGECDACART